RQQQWEHSMADHAQHSRVKAVIEWVYLLFHGLPAAVHGCGHFISALLPWVACVNWAPWATVAAVMSVVGAAGIAYSRRPQGWSARARLIGIPLLGVIAAGVSWARPAPEPWLRWKHLTLPVDDPELAPFRDMITGHAPMDLLFTHATDNTRISKRRRKSGYETPGRTRRDQDVLQGEN